MVAKSALYEVLGVKLHATAEEIEKAYFKKISSLPNRGVSGLMVRVFGLKYQFDYAYGVLGNASKRKSYDIDPDMFDSVTPNYLGF